MELLFYRFLIVSKERCLPSSPSRTCRGRSRPKSSVLLEAVGEMGNLPRQLGQICQSVDDRDLHVGILRRTVLRSVDTPPPFMTLLRRRMPTITGLSCYGSSPTQVSARMSPWLSTSFLGKFCVFLVIVRRVSGPWLKGCAHSAHICKNSVAGHMRSMFAGLRKRLQFPVHMRERRLPVVLYIDGV